MRLKPSEFWDLTYAEFMAMYYAYNENEKQDYIQKYNLNVCAAFILKELLLDEKADVNKFFISEKDLKEKQKDEEPVTEPIDPQGLISLMHAIDFSEKAVKNAGVV